MKITQSGTYTKGYTVVANTICRDRNLGAFERGILCTLLSRPKGWRYSIAGLTAILPNGRDAIRASIVRLEERGYLRRGPSRDAQGCFAGEAWEIIADPDLEHEGETPTENGQGYTKVDNGLLYDDSLGAAERGIMVTLLSLPPNWDFSLTGLTRIMPTGKCAMAAGIKKLEARGYLWREQTRDAQGHFCSEVWVLVLNPKGSNAEKPMTENPLTDYRDTVKPAVVKSNATKTDGVNKDRLICKDKDTYHTITNQSINQNQAADGLSDGDEEIAVWIGRVKDQIDYDLLGIQLRSRAPFGDLALLDAAVIEIARLYCRTGTLPLGDRVYDVQQMRVQAEKMDARRVGHILIRVWRKGESVFNQERYLLGALLNEK